MIQMAALLAVDYGWQTHLICPREPARYVAARLLANQSRVPMADVATGQSDDPERAQRVRQLLEEAPLHIAAQGEPHGLDVVGELERALPDALLLDDADTVPGAFPDRLRTLADAGVFVAGTMPRHLIVDHDSQGPHLRPEWAAVADVVLEVRQATWPADTHGIRPGEADLILLKNRWGPTITASVILAAHYAEFSDFEHGNTGEQS